MKYFTRDFGEIDIESGQILSFRQPIFGFDEYRSYAVLHDPDMGEEVAWLQSLEEPDLCFVIISARVVAHTYNPPLPDKLDEMIGEGEYELWLIAVIHDDWAKSTINLKSPVYINWKTGLGAQVILEGDFPVRRPLMEEAEGQC